MAQRADMRMCCGSILSLVQILFPLFWLWYFDDNEFETKEIKFEPIEHKCAQNPNWSEADLLTICKRGWNIETQDFPCYKWVVNMLELYSQMPRLNACPDDSLDL